MAEQGYDVIGDIHGHADELVALLTHMGYRETDEGYRHPTRKAVFVGDFVDRGEHLAQHRQLLETVMPMVNNGHAYAVMGNHEFNALAFHHTHEGEPLREHSPKNIEQHQAFLNEFQDDPAMKQKVLDFFFRLPLWLELDGLRAVHACWHPKSIGLLTEHLDDGRLTLPTLVEASREGSPLYEAVETILKGVEEKLPDGIKFYDKGGHEREEVRIQWWNRNATRLGELVLPFDLDIGEAAQEPVPKDVTFYPEDAPPCFVGHYWMKGEPAPVAPNVACVDHSVAKDGKLVAYRWDGEARLSKDKFAWVRAASQAAS